MCERKGKETRFGPLFSLRIFHLKYIRKHSQNERHTHRHTFEPTKSLVGRLSIEVYPHWHVLKFGLYLCHTFLACKGIIGISVLMYVCMTVCVCIFLIPRIYAHTKSIPSKWTDELMHWICMRLLFSLPLFVQFVWIRRAKKSDEQTHTVPKNMSMDAWAPWFFLLLLHRLTEIQCKQFLPFFLLSFLHQFVVSFISFGFYFILSVCCNRLLHMDLHWGKRSFCKSIFFFFFADIMRACLSLLFFTFIH